jgi:hypothetical protein
MDCSNARLLLAFARPRANELPHPEAAELRHHLDTCTECAAHASAERRADDHLGRAVRDVPMPNGLKGRLLERLKAERGPARRRWVARVAGVAGVAAALLLGVGLWALLSRGRPTTVDLAVWQGQVANKTSNDPNWIEQWFQDTHGVVMATPRSLDYSLLVSYDLVTLPDGKQVPKLLFVRGQHRLVVYVLDSRQFSVPDRPVEESLQWTGRVIFDDDKPFTYLLFNTGGREVWRHFCPQGPPAA